MCTCKWQCKVAAVFAGWHATSRSNRTKMDGISVSRSFVNVRVCIYVTCIKYKAQQASLNRVIDTCYFIKYVCICDERCQWLVRPVWPLGACVMPLILTRCHVLWAFSFHADGRIARTVVLCGCLQTLNICYACQGIIYTGCPGGGGCARIRDNVPYVKVHRSNPKHLYPKLNGYGDNGERKVWSSCGSTYCTYFACCYPSLASQPSQTHSAFIINRCHSYSEL